MLSCAVGVSGHPGPTFGYGPVTRAVCIKLCRKCTVFHVMRYINVRYLLTYFSSIRLRALIGKHLRVELHSVVRIPSLQVDW